MINSIAINTFSHKTKNYKKVYFEYINNKNVLLPQDMRNNSVIIFVYVTTCNQNMIITVLEDIIIQIVFICVKSIHKSLNN